MVGHLKFVCSMFVTKVCYMISELRGGEQAHEHVIDSKYGTQYK